MKTFTSMCTCILAHTAVWCFPQRWANTQQSSMLPDVSAAELYAQTLFGTDSLEQLLVATMSSPCSTPLGLTAASPTRRSALHVPGYSGSYCVTFARCWQIKTCQLCSVHLSFERNRLPQLVPSLALSFLLILWICLRGGRRDSQWTPACTE